MEKNVKSGLTISFLGDISLNDAYNEMYKRDEDPFGQIGNQLSSSDYVVGNLECMAKGEDGENNLKRPRLCTNSETLHYLNDIHLSIATLANNHVYDHLLDGYYKTTLKLDELGIDTMGAGLSQSDASAPLIIEKKGVKVGLLNYITADTNPNLPKDCPIFLNFFDIKKAKNDIRQLKTQVDHIVVLLHWGGTVENGYYPDSYQPDIANKLVSAGAALVIGHHSHTFQPFEQINKKMIFYSLGNFCFSDIHFDNKVIELEKGRQTESAIVDAEFSKNNIKTVVKPIIFTDGSPSFRPKLLKKYQRRNRRFQVLKQFPNLWTIYYWKLKKLDPLVFYLIGNGRNPVNQLKKLSGEKMLKYLGFH